MHVFDVNPLDALKRLWGIANGDALAFSATVFHRILRGLFGSQIDVTHPSRKRS